MVQPGPDNADTGWAYTSGYQYRAPRILGFSQTRASGTGIPELGDVLLQPLAPGGRGATASRYAKASEVARPGYYAVTLTDNAARVELTSTARVARHRYTFARGGRVSVLADFQHGLRFKERAGSPPPASPLGRDRLEGSVSSDNWTKRTVAFSVVFDHPIAARRLLPPQPGDKAPRYRLDFDLGKGRVLNVKAALATTDPSRARGATWPKLPGWDFDATAAAAAAEWEALLGRVRDRGTDSRTRRNFYHRALSRLPPSERDLRHRRALSRAPPAVIAKARGKAYYSTLSLWDTFPRRATALHIAGARARR